MTPSDVTVIILMGLAAVSAAVSFAVIVRYLFDHGLADRNAHAPDIRKFYKTYLADTRNRTGRIGGLFWVHSISAALFIAMGMGYTIYRFILPRLS